MKLTAKEIRDRSPKWLKFIRNTDRLILAGKIKKKRTKK